MAALIPKRVTLFSEDRELAGHLFQSSSATAPGVVVAGSWTTGKEQMADLHAGKLAEAGSTTLTFDFTGFGKSTGEPRQYESPHRKIADLAAAARWLAARDDVEGDGVGGLAICASAGYMAHAIAGGAPFSSFATVAAWLHGAGTVGEMYGGDQGVADRIGEGEEAQAVYDGTGEVRTIPAYDDKDPRAAMGEVVAAYQGDPEVGAVPPWINELAMLSWPGWLGFDALALADRIVAPALMIHSEQAAFPNNARRFADALRAPQTVLWRAGSQIDFYYRPEQVDPAIEAVAEHFCRNLAGPMTESRP